MPRGGERRPAPHLALPKGGWIGWRMHGRMVGGCGDLGVTSSRRSLVYVYGSRPSIRRPSKRRYAPLMTMGACTF